MPGSRFGAGANKKLVRRNAELERDIAKIRTIYDDFTTKSDAFIAKLTKERDDLRENLKENSEREKGLQSQIIRLKSRNWWQRLTRKFE